MPNNLSLAISAETLSIARTAIRHLASGIKPWADLPDEARAKSMYAKMVKADQEISAALGATDE